MKRNLLDEWNRNLKTKKSLLNPNKSIELKDKSINFISDILIEFFTYEYFDVDNKHKYLKFENPIGENWLYHLLANIRVNTVNHLLEFTSVLNHYKKHDPQLLESLKSVKELKDFRRFRDLYFELYTFWILDNNDIPNDKKKFEGNKELEGVCQINGEECLFECKKLYAVNVDYLSSLMHIASEFMRIAYMRTFPMLVSIKIFENSKTFKNEFSKEIESIIDTWKNGSSIIITPITKKLDGNKVELYAEQYSPNRYVELINENKQYNNIVFESSTEDILNIDRPKVMYVKMNGSVVTSENDIVSTIIKKVKEKRKNRSESRYKYRIYLFENENYGGFDRGLFAPKTLKEDVASQLQKYLDSKKTDDVIILVNKDATVSGVERIKTYVFARQELREIKNEIEKWKFDYY